MNQSRYWRDKNAELSAKNDALRQQLAEVSNERDEARKLADYLSGGAMQITAERNALQLLLNDRDAEVDRLKVELTKARELLAARPAIDAKALHAVLSALCGPTHHIRELQVCRGLPDNPIDQLQREFNEWVAHQSAPAALNQAGEQS